MSNSDADFFSYFTPLDELIQLIYQGAHKFVALSAVDDASWTIHVGLTCNSGEGRWWKGRWSESDVRKFVVCVFIAGSSSIFLSYSFPGTENVVYCLRILR